MPAIFALKGLVVGLAVSAPIGPVGVLCIRRSVDHGVAAGWIVGLGAASADVVCAAGASVGVQSLASAWGGASPWLGLLAGASLGVIGVGLWMRARVPVVSPGAAGSGPLAGYLSALFVTLVNPLTSLSLVAVCSGWGIGLASSVEETAWFVGGVAAGAVLWWYLLSRAASSLATRISPAGMRLLNRVSALVLLLLGAHLALAAWR